MRLSWATLAFPEPLRYKGLWRGARFFDKGFAAKAIYGSISVLAVVLVMEAHPPTAWQASLTLFGTTLAIALAETYSETIGDIIAHRRRLDAHELKAIWHGTRPILLSANLPTLILLLSASGLLSISVALGVAEWAR